MCLRALLPLVAIALTGCVADTRSPRAWGVDPGKVEALHASEDIPLLSHAADRELDERYIRQLMLDRGRLWQARFDAAAARGRCDMEGCEAPAAPMSVLEYVGAEQFRADWMASAGPASPH